MLSSIGKLFSAGALCLLMIVPTLADGPFIFPIIEKADGELDTCALGEVFGLKSDGDGFLAVRAGPHISSEKIDEIHNGDRVYTFSQIGDWIGIAYATDFQDCSPIEEDRAMETDGKKGWVHGNWIKPLAG